MRNAAYTKVLACSLFSIVLCGCVQTLQDSEPKPPRAADAAQCASPVGKQLAGVSRPISTIPFNPAEAARKVQSYEAELQQSQGQRDVILTELARYCFMLGGFGEKSESEQYYEKGRHYAEILSAEEPARVEGHYWLAMNLAGLAEVGGAGRGLRLIPVIVEKLETALAIDETYDQGGPHRVLGRIRCQAPCWPLSEGNIDQSLEHLRAAVRIAPENSTNHLYLAETLYELGKTDEACKELERVPESPSHAVCPAGLRSDCKDALRLLRQYREQQNPSSLEKNGERTLPPGEPTVKQ